jgi:hypothetical protein
MVRAIGREVNKTAVYTGPIVLLQNLVKSREIHIHILLKPGGTESEKKSHSMTMQYAAMCVHNTEMHIQ